MSLFNHLTPANIGAAIRKAKDRVIYSAPSLTDDVASALIMAKDELGDDNLTVILDFSEHLFRLGYGTCESVKMLVDKGVKVRKQADLRIACLIIDGQGWVFSLMPMAVESQQMSGVNAVELSIDQVVEVIRVLQLEDSDESEIGEQVLSKNEVKEVDKVILNNPPQVFDLERRVRVYQAHLQFVELELEGGSIGQRTIKLPKDLKLAIFSNDRNIEERLNASYKLISGKLVDDFSRFRHDINSLRDSYAPSLGKRLGRVLLKSRKAEFLSELAKIEGKLDKYCKSALQSMEDGIEKSLFELANTLAPRVTKSPPVSLRARSSGIDDEISREYLLVILRKAAPSAEKLINTTKLHCTFKDVTIELLHDDKFQKTISELFPYEKWTKPFDDFEAAQAGYSVGQ